MNKIFFSFLVLSILLAGIFISCEKEISCEGCKPPIAIAGPDRVITLPTDSISLDGSASNDPDGTISEWLWKKISGPASFNIDNTTTAKTIVRNLDTGIYKFELKVTDDKNLSAIDTVQITVTDRIPTNRPPVAKAGDDQTIILPINTVMLDGSGSTDPDNNITAYVWTKISGPSSFNIANGNAVQTQVINLVEGVYQFELKVTDAGGLFDKDTVQVTVNAQSPPPTATCEPLNRPVVNAQLIPFGNLSIARTGIATVTAGNKIFFAGGHNSTGDISRVDIYDISSQSWSTAELSLARAGIKAIACGNKVLFASGFTAGGGATNTSRIDIYDLTTQAWSTAELPFAPVTYYLLKVASVGNKALFAYAMIDQNGIAATSNPVGIYDVSSQSWSTTTLSEPRLGFNALTVGNKVYFSGGAPDVNTVAYKTIDIYDNSTGAWSTSLLAEPKADHGGVYKNGKIYWAGGSTCGAWTNSDPVTCSVEIKDINTQTSTFSNLSQPGTVFHAFDINGKLAFFRYGGLNNFDIYDVSTNSWAIGVVNQVPSYYIGSSLVSINNAIFMAGGTCSGCQYYSQVWKLVF